MIEVGKRYKCQRDGHGFFTIIQADKKRYENQSIYFKGLSDDGEIFVTFEIDGRDEYREFGGRWWELDTTVAYPPKWVLIDLDKENNT